MEGYDPKKEIIKNGEWSSWSKHVILELDRLGRNQDQGFDDIYHKIDDLKACVNKKHSEQREYCAKCQKEYVDQFISQKVFYWVLGFVIAGIIGIGVYLVEVKQTQVTIEKKIEYLHDHHDDKDGSHGS